MLRTRRRAIYFARRGMTTYFAALLPRGFSGSLLSALVRFAVNGIFLDCETVIKDIGTAQEEFQVLGNSDIF